VRGGGRETGNSHENMVLSRLYEQVTQWHGRQYASGYDLAAALNRYRTWLTANAESRAPDDAAGADNIAMVPSASAVTEADAGHPGLEETQTFPVTVTGTLAAGGEFVPDGFLASSVTRVEWSADHAVIELYSAHYRTLVRLAAMLVRDTPTAEEVVQDAFMAMHGGWQRLKDTDKALAYLRQAVVNKSRSVLRHRIVVEKNLQQAPPDMPSAEHGAFVLLERSEVVAALRDLPARQREAIVLRYYADLSEAEIAATMGISRGAVKSHTARGMAALRTALEHNLWPEPATAPKAPRHGGTSLPSSCVVRCTRPWITWSRSRTAWNQFERGSRPGLP
jgi:RNA polymerase sigma-70 factor (sigma-E family)